MNIKAIVVNLDLDSFSPELVEFTANLARRFDASLIGHCSAGLSNALIGIDSRFATGALYEEVLHDTEADLATVEKKFRAAAGDNIQLDWVGGSDAPNQSIARIMHRADLIVTGSQLRTNLQYARVLDIGELILSAGRPVMVPALGAQALGAERIVVGWKNTREARRAIVDALPLLVGANEVTVAQVGNLASVEENTSGLMDWLERHGVNAHSDGYLLAGTPAETLTAIANDASADLIVAGGYGHNRLREWLLGGMTGDLLATPTINRFFSN